MSQNLKCPTSRELELFLVDQLRDDDAVRVSEHLTMCDLCTDTFDNLRGATNLEAGHDASPAVPSADSLFDDTPPPVAGVSPPKSSIEERTWSFLSPPLESGDLGSLGPYRVLKAIGLGGMGVVFQAEDPQLKRQVALKVVKPEYVAHEVARQRFLREAQAVAAINHDNVVAIYQVGGDEVPFLTMPLLEGETLAGRLGRQKTLPPHEALRIGRQIAMGMDAAHRRGVIHRDIKPANIWLEKGDDRVKLLDFGLARPADTDSNLTSTGTVAGTPLYMAPEQIEAKVADERSDLYSLGCVLYRMLTGETPFAASTPLAVLSAVANQNAHPLHEVAKDVPRPLSDLVMRLLEKDPDQRPQSAAMVLDEMERIQKSLDAAAVEPTPRVPIPNASLHPWRSVAAIATTVAVLSLLAAAVIVLKTPRGTVTIDTRDESVRVAIKRGGKLIEIVDADSAWTVRLREGSYEVELRNTDDRFTLENDKIDVVRGEQTLVKVVFKRNNSEAGVPQVGAALPNVPSDYALQFDGTNYVEVPSFRYDGTHPVTVEAWVTPNRIAGATPFVNILTIKRAATIRLNSKYQWMAVATRDITTGDLDVAKSEGTAAVGRKTHLALVWDDSQVRLYVDGKKQAETIDALAGPSASQSFRIGGYVTEDGDGQANLFHGTIDEVRISRVARYADNFVPQQRFKPDEATMALYHFDEGKGELCEDVSGNELHGKAIGAQWVKVDSSVAGDDRK
jgi:serine/threonine protein kinase